MCIGRTDLPLSVLGRMQAEAAASYLAHKKIRAVFCSHLTRSVETAEIFGGGTIVEGLEEMCAGEWDGLTFEEIRESWPEVFQKRGESTSIIPPGAEPNEVGARRFRNAVMLALEESEGDIVISTHASVLLLLLCDINNLPYNSLRAKMIPYGSVTELGYDEVHGTFHIFLVGEIPGVDLSDSFCRRLLKAARKPETVMMHCEAVRERAVYIAEALNNAGLSLDIQLVSAAALLHALTDAEHEDSKMAAEYLTELGIPEVADAVKKIYDFKFDGMLDEAAIVYMAEKTAAGRDMIPMRIESEISNTRYKNIEAAEADMRYYDEALELAYKINNLCGRDIIKLQQ